MIHLLVLIVLTLGLTTHALAQTSYTIPPITTANAAQDASLLRVARIACQEAKAANPGDNAPYGFNNDAQCTGDSDPAGLALYLHDVLTRRMGNAVQNLRDDDGREIGIRFSNESAANRAALKGACPTCQFRGE